MATYADDFTGTDATALAGREATQGATGQGWSWEDVSNGTFLKILSDQCQGTSGGWAICKMSDPPTASNVAAEFDYVQKGSRNGEFQLVIRKPTGGNGGYKMICQSNTVVKLYRTETGGTDTEIGSVTGPASPGRFRLEGIGSAIRVLKDDVAIISVSDSTWTGAGDVHFGIRDFGSPLADNFYAEDVFIDNEPEVRFAHRRDGLTLHVSADATTDDNHGMSYSWDWGDMSSAGSGVTASHTYASAGTYTVVLTVTDSAAQGVSKEHHITVVASNDPPTLDATGALSDPATNWADTPAIGQIGQTGEPGVAHAAFGKFTRWWYEEANGLFYVGVKAYHMNGIDRVEFNVNGSTNWAKVPKQTLNPQTGDYEYCCIFDPSDFGNDELVEIRARLYPTAGQGAVLQDSDGTEAAFTASLWLRCNVTNRVTYYFDGSAGINGDGSSGSPFNTWSSALNAARGQMKTGKPVTLVCTPDGDGDIDYGSQPSLNEAGTAWLTVVYADGYDKTNATLTLGKSLGSTLTASSGLMRVRFENMRVNTTPQADSEGLGFRTVIAHGRFVNCDLVGVLHYSSTLADAIDESQTTIDLVDASGFPETGTDQPILTGEDESGETISWTGKVGNTLTGVTRGSNFSTAKAHDAGSQVSLPGYNSTYFTTATPLMIGLEDCTLTDFPFEAGIMNCARAIRNTLTRVCENGVIGSYAIDTTVNSLLNSGHRDVIQTKGGTNRIIDGVFNLEPTTQTSLDDPNSSTGTGTTNAYYGRIYSVGVNSVGINFGENSDGVFRHIIVDQCSLPHHSINLRDNDTEDVLVRRCVSQSMTVTAAILLSATNVEFRDCYAQATLPSSFASGTSGGSGETDDNVLWGSLTTGIPKAGGPLLVSEGLFQEDSFAQRDMNGVLYTDAIGALQDGPDPTPNSASTELDQLKNEIILAPGRRNNREHLQILELIESARAIISSMDSRMGSFG